jgi:hypothetical protein
MTTDFFGGREALRKRAFFLSAFAALADPTSRIYYDKKIKEGKHHTQAFLCLARRRADVSSQCSATAPSTNPKQPGRDEVSALSLPTRPCSAGSMAAEESEHMQLIIES